MIRFIVREDDVGDVHAKGQVVSRLVSFDGDQERLEIFLRYEDCLGEKKPLYLSRQLVGVELL